MCADSDVINASAKRVIKDGREYLVAPMSMIVPGVLAGSEGPLYYPLEEIEASASAWNEIPIVVYHPTKDGRNVSANTPGVLEASGIGVVKKPKADGKLTAEGWFDVQAMQRVDKRVLQMLRANKPIELSTGLGTESEATSGIDSRGRPYPKTARNYQPDHLAILPDVVGACSIADGCGVLVNQQDAWHLNVKPLDEWLPLVA